MKTTTMNKIQNTGKFPASWKMSFFAHDVYVQQDSTDSASDIGYRNIMLDIINGLMQMWSTASFVISYFGCMMSGIWAAVSHFSTS